MKLHKISFCTTCMNRVHHLKETLHQNISDNFNYENLEFVLIDYNSQDGLADYILENLNDQLINGRLVYYRTNSPVVYNMSHSRNIAFKLASGDIVCNIDADNFTGQGFAEYVNKEFCRESNIFLSTHFNSPEIKNDVLGRICVKKEDFLSIGGYEERMKHYGFDDFDFAYRLEMDGIIKRPIADFRFLRAIGHSNRERMSSGIDNTNFHSLYIRYKSPFESELLILFNNNLYKRATMVNTNIFNASVKQFHKISTKYDFSILENNWIEGIWNLYNQELIVSNSFTTETLHWQPSLGAYHNPSFSEAELFFKIENNFLIEEVLFFYQQLSNRIIMEENIQNNAVKANPNGFGKDLIYKNFNVTNPIML